MSRLKRKLFIAMNGFLLVTSSLVILFFAWLVIDMLINIANLAGIVYSLAMFFGLTAFLIGLVIDGGIAFFNILIIDRAIDNFKNKAVTDKAFSVFKADSWICVFGAFIGFGGYNLWILSVYFIIKVIILRLLISSVFYSEYGRKKIKDKNESDEVK